MVMQAGVGRRGPLLGHEGHDRADAVACVRRAFARYSDGTPRERGGRRLYAAWQVARSLGPELEAELMYERFDAGKDARHRALVAANLVRLGPADFVVGGPADDAYTYVGEEPAHVVRLPAFALADRTVTNADYRAYDPTHAPDADGRLPVVDVTWYDAVMFCRWLGVRLPTEAEWEYACRGGWTDETAQPVAGTLARYAWHSENAGGRLHGVGLLEPNPFGIFDLQGNVWEWCQDTYDPGFYARSPVVAPVNLAPGRTKVCRGGSYHGFHDMCRSTLRYHEPPDYWASDIGFRCAIDVDDQGGGHGGADHAASTHP
jgi:formylglycine-generating enzyme required for sulfatase activity